MTMAVTTQREYEVLSLMDRVLIMDIAEGGSITVEYLIGAKWIVSDTFTESGVKIVYFGGAHFRITPTEGTAFALG